MPKVDANSAGSLRSTYMNKHEFTSDPSKMILSDAQWNAIVDALSGNTASRAKHDRHHYRMFVNAVLWVAVNRAFWSELPAEYGSCRSVYARYLRWCEADTWSRVEYALGASDLGALLTLLLVQHGNEQRKREHRYVRRESRHTDNSACTGGELRRLQGGLDKSSAA
ncbi:transposase [Lysobacter antibioticus]|uniref:transposase n=1 Tax=Lysobacter antibioticus TaxID=84531 RepID=UPI0009E6A808